MVIDQVNRFTTDQAYCSGYIVKTAFHGVRILMSIPPNWLCAQYFDDFVIELLRQRDRHGGHVNIGGLERRNSQCQWRSDVKDSTGGLGCCIDCGVLGTQTHHC